MTKTTLFIASGMSLAVVAERCRGRAMVLTADGVLAVQVVSPGMIMIVK